MIVVNIHEAKAKLSEFLDAVATGERVVICKRNQPVAELRAIEQKRTEPRPLGGGPHIELTDAFFEPMPDEFLDAFEFGPIYPSTVNPSRGAARPATRRSQTRRKHRV